MADKLEKLILGVSSFHTQEFSPAVRRVELPHPNRRNQYEKRATHVSLGAFYEILTRNLFGGSLISTLYARGNGQGIDSTIPDVIDSDKNQIWESKAACLGHSCNLLDIQIKRYEKLQLETPESKISFVFYRHNVYGIKSYSKKEAELYKELSGKGNRKTYYALSLPFSVVLNLFENKDGPLTHRYDGDSYDRCTCIRSPTLNRFFMEPENIIEEVGLNHEDFTISRYISPKEFRLGTRNVKQFPIVSVEDKNHQAWVKEFVEKTLPF